MTSISKNKRTMEQTKLRHELHKRGLCVACYEINDNLPTHKCKACSRRQYVRERLKVVTTWIAHYQREQQWLLQEDERWRREHKRARRGTRLKAVGKAA